MVSPASERTSYWSSGTFFASLGDKPRKDLLELVPPVRYPAGTTLVRQGEPGMQAFLLRSTGPASSACVKVIATLENGSESMLGIRVGGDVIGEVAAIRATPRNATVVTCTPILAHPLPREMFLAFLNRHPEAWQAIAAMMADRLDWANRRRLEFVGYDVPIRLARIIVELADRHGRDVAEGRELGVRLSQPELGKLIGAGEDAVGQAMRRFRDEGYVLSKYRAVTILTPDRLRAFAELPPRHPSADS